MTPALGTDCVRVIVFSSSDGGGRADVWPITGFGTRDIFIARPLPGAFCIDRRTVLISPSQRVQERFCSRWLSLNDSAHEDSYSCKGKTC